MSNTCPGQGYINFPKIYDPPQNSIRQKCDKKQLPYRRPTYMRCHCSKISRAGDKANRIRAALAYVVGVR